MTATPVRDDTGGATGHRTSPGGRNTAVLVVFTAASNLADGVIKMTLPLLATQLTRSPAQVTAVSLALMLPWLLTALHIGVLVDRLDRRRLLWAASALRLAAVAWPASGGRLSLTGLIAAGVVLGVADVLAGTAGSALVVAAVPPAGREKANTWMAGAETVCQEFTGPFLGGLLLAAGTGFALGATWVTYALSALSLFLLAGRFKARHPEAAAAGTSVHAEIGEGLRHLWQQTLLRTMALILTVLCTVWGAWLALIPLYAQQDMGLDARGYGILLSALGVGGLVGALTVTWINRLIGVRWALLLDLVGTAAMAGAPALTVNVWAVAAGAFLGGMGGTLWTVNARTIAQRLVPDRLQGRYNAASRLLSWGAMPLGAGLVGLLAQVAGSRTAFGVLAVGTLVSLIPFLRVVTPAALRDPASDT
ncbi:MULTISPECIES: MFS transporter [unclassified Streptomyces]|uniref:MFS transporter n=1 Tax=unclassified Streptomyces TaxID=2593676 RepID=UPI000F6BC8F0|nr:MULTISPECIES: MFS transporter [unclassified Streptomyces]AZM58214.1 MFS transporter [Streptomyces sp. WAC 01438]RSM98985.1 MFS transporter [Streptomyces sp. WAC 01420]